MTTRVSGEQVAGTFAGAALVVLGCWLPWVRKRPVGYSDAGPVYTREWIAGLEAGFGSLDYILAAIVLVAVCAVVVARNRGVLVSGLLTLTGVAVALVGADVFLGYRSVDRYAVEPGLSLVLAGGAILVAIGVGGLGGRLTATSPERPRPADERVG
jgi:hypothetical protein